MSTKSKTTISSSRTSTQKPTTKLKGQTSDRKPESVRYAKEKTEEKSKLEINKNKYKKEDKEKTKPTNPTKQMTIRTNQTVKKPTVNTKIVPQSKRIVKSQYFPSKNNYSEILKHLNRYEVGDGSKKIESKSSITRESSVESISTSSERPRTSTLRKASIVHQNIAGPEVPKKPTPPEEPPKTPETEDYEDDFDSYESDFENVTSSDSTIHNFSEISTESTSSSEEEAVQSVPKDLERKLDSGNFDLKEDKKNNEFQNLQNLIEKENFKLKRPDSNIRSNLTSLSDEGFEEAKSLQFLNFVSAKKRNDRRKSMEVRRKRGEELLNMIKLDNVNFTIMDMSPVPYEQFIKTYGNLNSIQIGIQAKEENIDEEIQTETIQTNEKWTQMPPNISKDSSTYKFDRIGVGPSETQMQEQQHDILPAINEYRLNKFVTNATTLILDILKEKNVETVGDKSKTSFSDTVVALAPPSEFATHRKVALVVPNLKNSNVLLSVHVQENGDGFSKSMVYLWNINEAIPEEYMACYGVLRSCCFGSDSKTVLGGLENGSLVIWETSERDPTSTNVCSMIEGDVLLRCPTFITDVEKSHCGCVVAIQCVSEYNENHFFEEKDSSLKVCSLDQEGTVILWNVIAKQRSKEFYQIKEGMKLMKNFEVNLRKSLPDLDDLLCNDMFVTSVDSIIAFIATNYGTVLQCDLNKEKTHVKIHSPEMVNSPVKCLVPCPFSKDHFLAGAENGNILLYSRRNVKPLMVITNKDNDSLDQSIDGIQWSLERPCMFYTKSCTAIDCWDLSRSSVFPIETLRLDETVTCLRLSRGRMERSFMITSTNSNISLHFLNREHRRENDEQYIKDIKTFLTYVDRL